MLLLLIAVLPILFSPSRCDRLKFMIGAKYVRDPEFPIVVQFCGRESSAFNKDGFAFCSGTLISSRHVLTAAHCCEQTSLFIRGAVAIVGSVFYRCDDVLAGLKLENAFNVVRVNKHPGYNDITLSNDIAIVELLDTQRHEIRDVAIGDCSGMGRILLV
uniref:Peptidase S1 domain-containing protein n=1 Tax=Steinernema glaseri TaxID=37863 RepID=A0A1I8AH23_9BILA